VPAEAGIGDIPFGAGPLGKGLSNALGVALGRTIQGKKGAVDVLLADGDSQEGQVMEAVRLASHLKLGNLVVHGDWNDIQLSDLPSRTVAADMASIVHAAGWHVVEVQKGNDIASVRAALTGHLVLSTLHTNSAAGAVARLLDMGIEPFLLVSTLRVIIGQRLVRRLTPDHEPYELTKDQQADLENLIDQGAVLKALKEEKIVSAETTWKNAPFYKPHENGQSPSGYATRIGIYEVLPVTSTIKELIMKSAAGDEIHEQARKEGMLTMSEDGIFKSVQGLTTIEEVLRVITE
jgi:hypothetical protein